MSTIIGGGIVGIPYAFYYLSLEVGLTVVAAMAFQTVLSVKIYLEAKDLIPGSPESLFEIGFILFKRRSIFFVCFIIIFNSLGLMLIYFIVFGDTMSSVVSDLSENITKDDFLGKREAYVILLSLLLVPLVIKKEL